jgi:adenylylsulfate kinase-like enzyme
MGYVFWITGLSAAGKTTLARELAISIKRSRAVVLLDGDQLRNTLSVVSDYSQSTRYELAFKYAKLAKLIASQDLIVIVSTVSLIKDIHKWNRQNQPNLFEIYLKVPLDELRRRDPKGHYKKYDNGEIKNLAGLDLEIDEPSNPDLLIDFYHHQFLTSEMVKLVLNKFHEKYPLAYQRESLVQ